MDKMYIDLMERTDIESMLENEDKRYVSIDACVTNAGVVGIFEFTNKYVDWDEIEDNQYGICVPMEHFFGMFLRYASKSQKDFYWELAMDESTD